MLTLASIKDPRVAQTTEGMTDCKGVDMDNLTPFVRDYKDYINSLAWRYKKIDWLNNFGLGASCFVCEKTMPSNRRGFNFHHRTYKRLMNEEFTDLVLLCREHHHDLEVTFRLRRKHKRSRNEPDESLWDWTYYYIWFERQILDKKPLAESIYAKHLPREEK